MRIVKDLKSYAKGNKIRIAYSICGEGHGHYGRNVEIIKTIATKLPNCEINLYLYGDTWNIFKMDKTLPSNVHIKNIPGFRFIYHKSGSLKSLRITMANSSNWGVFLRIIKLDFLHTSIFPIRKLFNRIFRNIDWTPNRYYMKYFGEFDIAITDLEPLLPRVADVRRKPFITIDNQHIMLFGKVDSKNFSIKERMELFFVKNVLKIYHPFSDLFIISTFHNLPIADKYNKFVKEVGPVIRKELLDKKKNIESNDFILVYAHKFLSDKIFPILTKIDNHKFVVFTNADIDKEDFEYKRKWIEYHNIDPVKFVDRLTKCSAVFSTAGNTLISESFFLKKPFFAISLQGNFEQRLNLYMLKKSGYGEGCKVSNLCDDSVKHFLDNLDIYKKRLDESDIQDNTERLSDMIIEKINRDVIISD